jgi:dTDP-glucose 4,6-dehydratase
MVHTRKCDEQIQRGIFTMTTILITGGCGFIGYNFADFIVKHTDWNIVNVDSLTYAGATIPARSDRYTFYQASIGEVYADRIILKRHRPDIIVNFAAETHVDRAIAKSQVFIDTNVVSTYNFIVEVQKYYDEVNPKVRFVHVSTDEVFGDLRLDQPESFTEESPYRPNNPYSATKAAGDHLVRAFHRTYGLPAILTNCCNNYGPYQFPEKFIPVIINKAMRDEPIPVYGVGANVRDWIFVEDHCSAIYEVALNGRIGERYNIGASNEINNLNLVKMILDRMGKPHSLISFVADRKGHDLKYSIDSSKIRRELGWEPKTSFDVGLDTTIEWYRNNTDWIEKCTL